MFPCKSKSVSRDRSSYTILYENELKERLMVELTTLHQSPPEGKEVTLETKIIIAKVLYYTIAIRHYPETEEDAIYEVAMWLYWQSDDDELDMSTITRIPYNSIKLSKAQKGLRSSLLDSNRHCTILWGAYGVGKSVVMVRALKN